MGERIAALTFLLWVFAGLDPAAALPQASPDRTAGAWRHLSMDDVRPALERFRPMRARYLQVMYDLDGGETVEGGSMVVIDLDRAVHSGAWDGSAPAVLKPFREPGLLIVWQIQNALYSGFDRVLTDSRLSLKQRVMPAGFSGLLMGLADGDEVVRIDATPPDSGAAIPVARTRLPEGSVNVLTIPYVLASMDLEAGDRFTLPGYELIGGPDGGGVAWRGGVWVRSVRDLTVRGEPMRVAEVFFKRVREEEGDAPDFSRPGERMTLQLISDSAPYLLGRADIILEEDGSYRFVREFLGLVDWVESPLPTSDNGRMELWDLDMEAAEMRLRLDRVPPTLVPLRPTPLERGSGSP